MAAENESELTLHPDARRNFDERVHEIKLKLAPQPAEFQPKRPQSNPHIPIAASFDDSNIIGEIKFSRVGEDGKLVCREFHADERFIGLYGEDHGELARVAEGLQAALRPKNVVSVETLEDLIFEWIKRSYRAENLPSLSEFVIAECEKIIVKGEMWIPISHFHIPMPFRVGNVTFKLITKEFMDEYEAAVMSKTSKPEEVEAVQIGFKRKRTDIQGVAAGIITFGAEPAQAYKNALEEVERSLAASRFFSYFCMVPTSVCYSAPMDKQKMDGYRYLVLASGKVVCDTSGILDKGARPWNIPRPDLEENFRSGLEILDDLLRRDSLTDFQEALIEALLLYSKATLAKELSDRLLYTLVALETLFLRDASELIQENISLRMALMQPVAVGRRREIIRNVKEAYALRSKFVHHGHDVKMDDLQVIRTFGLNAWYSVFPLIQTAKTDITRRDFFEELENRKVSG